MRFPVRVEKADGANFAYIVDSLDEVIAGALTLENAEQLVTAANAGAKIQAQPLAKQPRRKNKRERIAEELKASDYSAHPMDRNDVGYGPHDSLPQCGESVARLKG